jgi:hypothetical protein
LRAETDQDYAAFNRRLEQAVLNLIRPQ